MVDLMVLGRYVNIYIYIFLCLHTADGSPIQYHNSPVRSWYFQLNPLTKTSSKEKQMDTSSWEFFKHDPSNCRFEKTHFFCWYALAASKCLSAT